MFRSLYPAIPIYLIYWVGTRTGLGALKSKMSSPAGNKRFIGINSPTLVGAHSLHLRTLKMEAADTSETLVTARGDMPEDNHQDVTSLLSSMS
jgi:hypothetical protein